MELPLSLLGNLLKDPGTIGVWTLVLIGLIYFFREWRESRKLSAEDKLARRDGYAKQVEMLMAENRSLAKDQVELREEYKYYRKACQEETDELRIEIFNLRSSVEEYRRRNGILMALLAQFKPNEDITALLLEFDRPDRTKES